MAVQRHRGTLLILQPRPSQTASFTHSDGEWADGRYHRAKRLAAGKAIGTSVKFHPPQSAKQGSRPQTEPDVLPKKFLEVTKPKVKVPIILLKI